MLQMPLHERADERFVWNRFLIRDLASQPELSRFVLPVMHGCKHLSTILPPITFLASSNVFFYHFTVFQTHHCMVNRKKIIYTLVSRRCCFRAGTRFFMRGVDQEGQVANYVETEQIVEYQGDKASFIQVRNHVHLLTLPFTNIYPFFQRIDERLHSDILVPIAQFEVQTQTRSRAGRQSLGGSLEAL